MRIDPKGRVGQYSALLVRTTLRRLRERLPWGLADLETVAGLAPGGGHALLKTLRAEGLIEAGTRGAWTVTQAGRTFSAATAAQPVTRATAERALSRFLDRVKEVNENPYFLARVTRVVLFGSMLKPEVDRLSDVDVTVELAPKESDSDHARVQNQQRVEELAGRGHQFRNFLECEGCWYLEAFRFLKGRSRVIALSDYSTGKAFVLAVPHRVLIGEPEETAVESMPRAVRERRPRGLPF